jgi:hypothetical protein
MAMRGFPILTLMIFLSNAAVAQTMATPSETPPAAAAPASPAPAGISRDDYIAKARDAAVKRAEKRFDAMDANHDGFLTKDEIAAYRAAHPRTRTREPQ